MSIRPTDYPVWIELYYRILCLKKLGIMSCQTSSGKKLLSINLLFFPAETA